MHPRSDLVVIAARGAEHVLYLDVLRDWSALGLIADFVVVDVERERELQGSPCLAVSGGRVRTALLQQEIARRSVTRTAHVVCISHVGEDFATVGAQRGLELKHEVRDALPGAEVTAVHLIGVAQQAQTALVPPQELAWLGAYNVVLAPENAQSPLAGVAPIVGGPASSVTHTHLAAGLCSAVGLWVADRRTPFYGEPDVAGENLVALRTYTRHLSARSVESQLVEHVMDVKRGYPVPMSDGMPAQRLEDEAGAASGMADSLLAKHSHVLSGQRRSATSSAQEQVPFLKALGMMLRFLGKAIVGAPRAFMDSLVHAVSQRLATATQAFAFGGDSAYFVTVGGIRGIKRDGTVATVEELDSDLGRLLGQLKGLPGSVPPESHDLTEFWKDFVAGGLTLLDGSKRSEGLEPVRVGSGLGVVTSPHVVAPATRDAFEVAPDLSGYAKIEEVAPYDVDGARRTHELLGEQATQNQQAAPQLEQERNRLRAWFSEREVTYTGRVGHRLFQELSQVRGEIVGYGKVLSAAQDRQEVPEELANAQAALARVLFALTGGAMLVLLALAGLALLDVLGWMQAGPVMVVVVLVWLVWATRVFLARQRRLFALMHTRQQAAEQLAAVKENLADALTDLRRLQRTYRQFLDWARALGTFVAAPWGHRDSVSDREAVFGAGYPHNHRFGTALPDADAVGQVAARLRPQLFPVGWTSGPWETFVGDVPAIGADTHFLEDEPGLIYSDRAVATRSVLTQWSEAVANRDWRGGHQQVADRLHNALRHDVGGYRNRLLGSVTTLTIDDEPSTDTYDDFMAGLREDSKAGSFSRWLFTDVPETGEPWRVREALVTNTDDEFSSSLVLTQLTVGFTPRDLRFVEQRHNTEAARQPLSARPDQAPQV